MNLSSKRKKRNDQELMDTKGKGPSILMFPWLAHGHISPNLQLAKRLAQRHFNVYLCSTAINLKPIRHTTLPSSIQLVEIDLPVTPDLPPHLHTTRNLPRHLGKALITALDGSEPAFCRILDKLKPDIVVYDYAHPWVAEAARRRNINAVIFFAVSAITHSFLFHRGTTSCRCNDGCPFSELKLPESMCDAVTKVHENPTNGLTDLDRLVRGLKSSHKLLIVRSSRIMEAKYIDLLEAYTKKEVASLGHMVEQPEDGEKNSGDCAVMDFLGKKEPASVVLVAFGSEYFLSQEESDEIARGLELGEANFIWVLRFNGGDHGKTVREVLPAGFPERVGERGLVVEGWVPQAKILSHRSTGGIVSHCGWGTTLEAVMLGGQPHIAIPMHSDQPLHAKLVEKNGMGVEVKRRKDGRIDGDDLGRVIREVVAEKRGKEMREKAREMREKLRQAEDREMDSVVKKLASLVE